MLSVIIPAYNEEATLEKTTNVITRLLTDAEIDSELHTEPIIYVPK